MPLTTVGRRGSAPMAPLKNRKTHGSGGTGVITREIHAHNVAPAVRSLKQTPDQSDLTKGGFFYCLYYTWKDLGLDSCHVCPQPYLPTPTTRGKYGRCQTIFSHFQRDALSQPRNARTPTMHVCPESHCISSACPTPCCLPPPSAAYRNPN